MNGGDLLWPVDTDDRQTPQSVLIVDDRIENLVSLETILEESGARIVKAQSGKDALQKLLEHDIALVLLDIAMPEMDGFEVADIMRRTKRTRFIPIIFITAFMRDEYAALRGYQAGAIDYLYKPVNATVLLSKVSQFLELNKRQCQLVEALRRIDDQRNYYESILDAAGEGVLVLAPSGQIMLANPAAIKLLDTDEATLLSRNFSAFCNNPDGENFLGYLLQRVLNCAEPLRVRDGVFFTYRKNPLFVSFVCSPLAGHAKGAVLVFQDMTEQKALEEQLSFQAHTDFLTGLHNRSSFKNLLQVAVNRNERIDKHLAILFIDLDRFKLINDTLGHDVGDQLLQSVATVLLSTVRNNDVVARLGGDEFTVILEELNDPDDAALIARKILAAFEQPFVIDNRDTSIAITASIGIATHPDCGHDTSSLMQAADLAMYRSKMAGRNQCEFFTPEMNTRAQARMMLEQSLRQAVMNKELTVHYQPQVDIRTQRVCGFEALLRWRHLTAGDVAPSTFVPLLEETGLIVPLGNWLIETVCRDRGKWQTSGLIDERCTVAINLSPRQFVDQSLLNKLQKAIDGNALQAAMIDIEITEGCLMEDVSLAQKVLNGIKNLGMQLSVDDFGTGYSSLAYLKSFNLDTLKIDRSFISNITTCTKDAAIATSIVQLAHNLGMKVIAEGVETAEQLGILSAMGCDLAQGFLYSPALPPDQIRSFLDRMG